MDILSIFKKKQKKIDERIEKTNLFRIKEINAENKEYSYFLPQNQYVKIYKGAEDLSNKIIDGLSYFNIKGKIQSLSHGPFLDIYSFIPVQGTKSSKIISLEQDLGMLLKSKNLRIILDSASSAINIEIPKKDFSKVNFFSLLRKNQEKLIFTLGTDVYGNIREFSLKEATHILIAGRTGSGKSSLLHAIISSLICNNHPHKCAFLMIDTKFLDLSLYDQIPHLICPVITQKTQAIQALRWINNEMERRYALIKTKRVLDIHKYNRVSKNKIPSIVIVIDEISDLMTLCKKEVESLIGRIAQMSRAAGIHLIISTQRPSVDVITNFIKANFPMRIAMQVKSFNDSRTIIDHKGAEKLLGFGDMLCMSPEGEITRMHAPYMDEEIIAQITQNVIKSRLQSKYRFVYE